MIGRLRGTYVDRSAATMIVECGGVGYEVHASEHTFGDVGPMGEEIILQIFTHAQENKVALFGFSSLEERALFDLLVTVKNVGPSSAIKILSAAAGPREIARMVRNENLAELKRIKGIGKKTAELIVVELRDKCGELLLSWGADASPQGGSGVKTRRGDPMVTDVAHALTQLGWRTPEVDSAVATLVVAEGDTLESLLRQALRSMPR